MKLNVKFYNMAYESGLILENINWLKLKADYLCKRLVDGVFILCCVMFS